MKQKYDSRSRFIKMRKHLSAAVLCLLLTLVTVIPLQAQTLGENAPLQFTKSVKKLTAGKSYRFRVNRTDGVSWSVGNEKIASVSKKMVLGSDNAILINLMGSVAVVFVILLFAYLYVLYS